MDDIISTYSDFHSLNAHHKIAFLFNSIDAFTCKKLGFFIYEAFALRNGSIDAGIVTELIDFATFFFCLFFPLFSVQYHL